MWLVVLYLGRNQIWLLLKVLCSLRKVSILALRMQIFFLFNVATYTDASIIIGIETVPMFKYWSWRYPPLITRLNIFNITSLSFRLLGLIISVCILSGPHALSILRAFILLFSPEIVKG